MKRVALEPWVVLLVALCAGCSPGTEEESSAEGANSAFSRGDGPSACVTEFASWRERLAQIDQMQASAAEKELSTDLSWNSAEIIALECLANGTASQVPPDVANELRRRLAKECSDEQMKLDAEVQSLSTTSEPSLLAEAKREAAEHASSCASQSKSFDRLGR